jgi:hypothetical protein
MAGLACRERSTSCRVAVGLLLQHPCHASRCVSSRGRTHVRTGETGCARCSDGASAASQVSLVRHQRGLARASDGGAPRARVAPASHASAGQCQGFAPVTAATSDAGHLSLRAAPCCDASHVVVVARRRGSRLTRLGVGDKRRAPIGVVMACSGAPSTRPGRRGRVPCRMTSDASGYIDPEADKYAEGAARCVRRYIAVRPPVNITPASAFPGISDKPPVPRFLPG